jgi:hypothetical protein
MTLRTQRVLTKNNSLHLRTDALQRTWFSSCKEDHQAINVPWNTYQWGHLKGSHLTINTNIVLYTLLPAGFA